MIINHKYKFIYFKTKKTASTTIEIALSEVCDQETDYMTKFRDIDEKLRWKLVRKHGKPALHGMTNHINAAHVKNVLPEKTWNTYTKITSVRNTYDMIISKYYWERDQHRNFDHWYGDFRKSAHCNWDIYSIDDVPAMDYYIRYENVVQDCHRLSKLLSLPVDLSNRISKLKTKDGFRKRRWPAINKSSLEKIAIDAKKEIDFFDYKIPHVYMENDNG